MKYLRLFSFIVIYIVLYSCSSEHNNFERELQVIKLLKDKKDIDVNKEERIQVFVLQSSVCGACTKEIISSILTLNLNNAIILLGDDNSILLHQFEEEVGSDRLIIDSTRVIDRYGLRYAEDVFVSFRKGKLDYWTFIKDETFNRIRIEMK